MIIIKNLTWSNWFSYGENNSLNIDDAKVIQITGKNGSGKSSIPVIIGEILYGKNAFGKVKSKLFNRYIDKPVLDATLIFEKDGKEYTVKYNRKTTLKLTLLENNVDISSHSTTNTLKTLNDILGFDFKLFWQLIYQSSTIGLEFLTATDTNRKKFLINLFNLDRYLTIHEQFKKINSEINSELLVVKGKLSTIESWIRKHEKEDLTEKEIKDIPSIDKEHIDKLTDLKTELANIKETNKSINDNNLYKNMLNELDTNILSETINIPNKKPLIDDKKDLERQKTQVNLHKKLIRERVDKLTSLQDKCDRCLQYVDQDKKDSMLAEDNQSIENAILALNDIQTKLTNIDTELKKISRLENKQKEKDKVANELQMLLSKIDNELPDDVLNEQELNEEITELTNIINSVNASIKIITKSNSEAESHNSKVKVIKEQLAEYKEQLEELQQQVQEKELTVEKISLIKKAFSTNGLLNYKIEFLVKDLEYQINTYLEELSNGRFQLLFALNGDKLDIDIIDDAKTIGIEELSAGELARINTSTLLAIRKLMAAISSTKLNILFLDEVSGVLDDEGKEKLIEILNEESDLNTFLVSHDYRHPLIPTLHIIKENKISKIDNE